MKSFRILALFAWALWSQSIVAQETQTPIVPTESSTEVDLLKAKQEAKEAKELQKKLKESQKEAKKAVKEAKDAEKAKKKAEKARKKAEKEIKKQEKTQKDIDARRRSIAKKQKQIVQLEGKIIKGDLKGKLSPVAKAKLNQKINNLKVDIAKDRERLDKLMRR